MADVSGATSHEAKTLTRFHVEIGSPNANAEPMIAPTATFEMLTGNFRNVNIERINKVTDNATREAVGSRCVNPFVIEEPIL
jgi:hypothetical protein